MYSSHMRRDLPKENKHVCRLASTLLVRDVSIYSCLCLIMFFVPVYPHD